MKYLITGVYGFLGYSTAKHLLDAGHTVIGIDRVQKAVSEKAHRIAGLKPYEGRFEHVECDISKWSDVERVFRKHQPKVLIHYAAQYSVPHSTQMMHNYIASNLAGFMHVCEAAKNYGCQRIVYASSTWVSDHDLPWTMYGATKQFNESAANIYSTQFDIPTIGLRYGSTFGPYVRNDIGPYIMAKRLFRGDPHPMKNAYIYKTAFLDVEDAIGATLAAIDCDLTKKHNIVTVVANDERHNLTEILDYFCKHTGLKAEYNGEYEDPGRGGIPLAEVDHLVHVTGYTPRFTVEDTAIKFIDWFREEWNAGRIK